FESLSTAVGAHYKPPGERPSMSMASGRSTPWRHQTSKWFVGVAQKAHIRSTSPAILSDTETTNRGVSKSMSALPRKAVIAPRDGSVRFVPKADILRRSEGSMSLFDHLVSVDDKRLRNREAKCLLSLEI